MNLVSMTYYLSIYIYVCVCAYSLNRVLLFVTP